MYRTFGWLVPMSARGRACRGKRGPLARDVTRCTRVAGYAGIAFAVVGGGVALYWGSTNTRNRAPGQAETASAHVFFASDGSEDGRLSRPVEGYDPFTPLDAECVRAGYEYRVHMPLLPGPWCAIFYEDDLTEREQVLAELGFVKTARFAVTPVSQAPRYPPPESTRGKARLTPQEFVARRGAIDKRLSELLRDDSRPILDANLHRSAL